jgi:hypothetical protein
MHHPLLDLVSDAVSEDEVAELGKAISVLAQNGWTRDRLQGALAVATRVVQEALFNDLESEIRVDELKRRGELPSFWIQQRRPTGAHAMQNMLPSSDLEGKSEDDGRIGLPYGNPLVIVADEDSKPGTVAIRLRTPGPPAVVSRLSAELQLRLAELRLIGAGLSLTFMPVDLPLGAHER